MRAEGYGELERERWVRPVDEIQETEEDEKCRTKLSHEVRHAEDVEYVEESETDTEVRNENAGNVDAANRENPPPRHLHPEEERDCDEEN